MTSESPIFLDSSFFKALIDVYDDFHEEALKIWKTIDSERISCVTSNYIIDESCTLIRTRCGRETMYRFRDFLGDFAKRIRIYRVTIQDDAEAWEWMENDWSHLSFTDCVSFVQLKRLNLSRAATFDGHFRRAGFEVVKG